MEAGEKELRKAFEEVTKGNVQAAVAHANETRKLLREVQEENQRLNNNIEMLRKHLEQTRIIMVQALQAKFSGGTEVILENERG